MAAEKLTLKVAAEASLEKGLPFWFGIRYGKVSVVYAGMQNEPAYSLALKCRSGHNPLASNMGLPVTQTRVEPTKGHLDAVKETPGYVKFKMPDNPWRLCHAVWQTHADGCGVRLDREERLWHA